MNRIAAVGGLLRDLRYAGRILRRSPAFTTAAVATLAVAIGINVAVFSIVDAVLLKPLPYPEPERLAMVSRVERGQDAEPSVTGRTWELVRDQAPSVSAAVFSGWTTGVNLVVPGADATAGARYVQQQRVGSGFFAVLGVAPMFGREFTRDEDTAGGPPATMLSAALWRSLFRADPSVVGRGIVLRGDLHTIVGVMPDGFQSGERADLWTPIRPSTRGEGENENYQILIRTREPSWAAAQTELAGVAAAVRKERPSAEAAGLSLTFVPLQRGMTQSMRRPLLMLWTAVGVVLLVACVNLAGLLMARGAGRARELATRVALGSGRFGVIRQLMVESLVLGLLGGAAGLLVGVVALDGLKLLAENAFEIWQPVALDGRALIAAAASSIAASLVFGLVPALQATRVDVRSGLVAGGSRAVAGGSRHWPQRVVIVSQVALGVVLLVAAGLLLRTFVHLDTLNPGFDPEGVVTAAVSLEDARYRERARVGQLFDDSLQRMTGTPGVESAAVALGLPYERLLNLGFRHLDGPKAGAPRGAVSSVTYVAGDFFRTMRIAVLRGRPFDRRDTSDAPPVVIVSETFARSYYPGTDAIGHRISMAGAAREIVAVVGDVQVRPGWGNNGPLSAMPLAYVPVAQVNDGFLRLVHGWFQPTFVVRSSLPEAAAGAAMRRALDAVDPLLPFAEVRPMSAVKAASLATQRFLMALLAALAGAATLLVAVGIHGLIAASVAERTREIGIRIALGATASRAVRTIAQPGVALAGIGVGIGLIGASAAGRLLRTFIWGVSPGDPLTYAAVAAGLLTVALAASIIPALRILRLDPATALRRD